MTLNIATMFATGMSAPKTMTAAMLREAEVERNAKDKARRQELAAQEAAAVRNTARVEEIKREALARHASDIEALAKTAKKPKTAPKASAKPASKKVAKKATAVKPAQRAATKKSGATKQATKRPASTRRAPAITAAPAPTKLAPAAQPVFGPVVSMLCDVRCGMDAAPGLFVGVSASRGILVVMQEAPDAAARCWDPSEVAPVCGHASTQTIAACWEAVVSRPDAPQLLLVG